MKPSSMKSSTLNKVVVKCADFWKDEIDIDSEIFDDIYAEAATRAIEKRKDLPGFKVTVILEIWEKKDARKPDKHFCYNTYRVLINAGMHEKAEMLRLNFMKMQGLDHQKESLKGEDKDGGSPTQPRSLRCEPLRTNCRAPSSPCSSSAY